MKKTILLILMGNRTGTAVKVQEILTDMGCYIKTRLGIHDGTPEACTNTGLVVLELIGDESHMHDLENSLNEVPDVKAELVKMSL